MTSGGGTATGTSASGVAESLLSGTPSSRGRARGEATGDVRGTPAPPPGDADAVDAGDPRRPSCGWMGDGGAYGDRPPATLGLSYRFADGGSKSIPPNRLGPSSSAPPAAGLDSAFAANASSKVPNGAASSSGRCVNASARPPSDAFSAAGA